MTQQNPLGGRKVDNRELRDTVKPMDEFELMRRRLRQRGAVTGQERQQELSRQFASLGNLPSGAALKARQQAAVGLERANNEAIQDVNMAEAETLRAEREGARERNLKRDMLSDQLSSTEKISANQLSSTEKISANQLKWAERERGLIEAGMNDRQARQIASNEDMFNIEMALKERGQTFLEGMQNEELALNKSISALNAVNLLTETGFGREEVAGIFETLGLPHANFLSDYFMDKRLPGDPLTGQLPGIANTTAAEEQRWNRNNQQNRQQPRDSNGANGANG